MLAGHHLVTRSRPCCRENRFRNKGQAERPQRKQQRRAEGVAGPIVLTLGRWPAAPSQDRPRPPPGPLRESVRPGPRKSGRVISTKLRQARTVKHTEPHRSRIWTTTRDGCSFRISLGSSSNNRESLDSRFPRSLSEEMFHMADRREGRDERADRHAQVQREASPRLAAGPSL